MSSAYGVLQQPKIENFIGLEEVLNTASVVSIIEAKEQHMEQLHNLLNDIIEEGKTYPQEELLTFTEFKNYFKTAFVMVQDDKVLGAFYVKPNFPGRCSHICNGGFIVQPWARGLGVGKALGRAFLKIAPQMGYKASMFNLVFENNIASVKLWKSLGFQVIGKVPKAGRLRGSEELVDALMFYYDFSKL